MQRFLDPEREVVAEIGAQGDRRQVVGDGDPQPDRAVAEDLLGHRGKVGREVVEGVVRRVDRPHQAVHRVDQVARRGLQPGQLLARLFRIPADRPPQERGRQVEHRDPGSQVVVHVAGDPCAVALDRVLELDRRQPVARTAAVGGEQDQRAAQHAGRHRQRQEPGQLPERLLHRQREGQVGGRRLLRRAHRDRTEHVLPRRHVHVGRPQRGPGDDVVRFRPT